MPSARRLDVASMIVIAVTFVLFAIAVGQKGLTHDLLLEAGVFLVSVKLILMSAKMSAATDRTQQRLDALQAAIDRLAAR
ncbi:MAG TPA: hypothetical protein VNW46_10320 [Gemmatimonadaceae bacterium]|jgi:hypothetical protein|nr:hypothetical protein [Gemmatimonadaceae bacterium]